MFKSFDFFFNFNSLPRNTIKPFYCKFPERGVGVFIFHSQRERLFSPNTFNSNRNFFVMALCCSEFPFGLLVIALQIAIDCGTDDEFCIVCRAFEGRPILSKFIIKYGFYLWSSSLNQHVQYFLNYSKFCNSIVKLLIFIV